MVTRPQPTSGSGKGESGSQHARGSAPLTIEQWPLAKLLRYANNSRDHSDTQIAQIAASIKEFGFVSPCLIDAKGVLIAGHGRVSAAQKLAMKFVPVIKLGHLTETQARALRIADNAISEKATWNMEMLRLELSELKIANYPLELTGFEQVQLVSFLSGITDPNAEWNGMPEFDQKDKTPFRTVWLHFRDQAAIDKFVKLTKLSLSESARYLWFPEAEPKETMVDKRYKTK